MEGLRRSSRRALVRGEGARDWPLATGEDGEAEGGLGGLVEDPSADFVGTSPRGAGRDKIAPSVTLRVPPPPEARGRRVGAGCDAMELKSYSANRFDVCIRELSHDGVAAQGGIGVSHGCCAQRGRCGGDWRTKWVMRGGRTSWVCVERRWLHFCLLRSASRRRALKMGGSGVEGVEVAACVFDVAFDVGGFLACCARAGAVFDVAQVA